MPTGKNARFFENQHITAANVTGTAVDADNVARLLDPIRSRVYNPATNLWYLEFDLGYSAPITFFSMIGKIDEPFNISSAATITLKANNVPSDWTSPPFSRTLTHSDHGIFEIIETEDSGYRYWRLDVDDSTNPTQNTVSYIMLSDHISPAINSSKGFQTTILDRSELKMTIDGTEYADLRNKRKMINGVAWGLLTISEKRELEEFFNDVGITEPFFFTIDPYLCFSEYIYEYTYFIRFAEIPVFVQVNDIYYTVSMNFNEVM